MEVLLEISTHSTILAILLIGLAWLWEDAALIAGALLAVDGHLSIVASLIAVFVGITSGDLGLYYLGYLARRVRFIRARILLNERSRRLQKRFRRHILWNILLIRFVPGLRTVGFTVCGLWALGLGRFLGAITLAGGIWIGVVYPIIYRLGSASWFEDSHWKWALMVFALALLIFNNVWPYRKKQRSDGYE